MPRLPGLRHRNPDLSGRFVSCGLVVDDGELRRGGDKRSQPRQTPGIGGGADQQQVPLGNRQQKRGAVLGGDMVQQIDRRLVVAGTQVPRRRPFGIEPDALARAGYGVDRDAVFPELPDNRQADRRIGAQQDSRRPPRLRFHRASPSPSYRQSPAPRNR